MGKKVTIDDVLEYLKELPFAEFKEVVSKYSEATGADLSDEMGKLVSVDFEKRLDKLKVNSVCPKCRSNNCKKNGRRKHIQLYKCLDCKTTFTRFTGTILEKTRWHFHE